MIMSRVLKYMGQFDYLQDLCGEFTVAFANINYLESDFSGTWSITSHDELVKWVEGIFERKHNEQLSSIHLRLKSFSE